MEDSLYIVIPAYNEEENIKNVVESWYPILETAAAESRLVVADSGSNDRTHDILEGMKETYPKLEILEGTDKNHGPKVIALYDYAIKKGVDYIFQTDSDDQTDPKDFGMFWRQRDKYDGLFGNRVNRGDGRVRHFVEKIVCILLRIYFGVKIPDANAPFRLLKTEILKKYIYRLPSDYNIPNIMVTTYFVYYGEKTKFERISFQPRKKGKNSINIKRILTIGIKAIGDFHYFKEKMKRG